MNETHGFLTDLEMSKSSSRLGLSSILKILQEIESLRFPKVTHPLKPFFDMFWGLFWDQHGIKYRSKIYHFFRPHFRMHFGAKIDQLLLTFYIFKVR